MEIIFIMIIWTWNITPLWVNIISTVILSIKVLCRVMEGAE